MKRIFPRISKWPQVSGAIVASAVLSAFCSSAHGQGASYSTDFNSPAYTGSETLSGQNGWTTNDPYVTGSANPEVGQSDYVGVVGGYSTSTTDYWAVLGGAERPTVPGMGAVYLYQPLSVAGAPAYNFTVDFSLLRSTTPYLVNDSFGWTFQNAAGGNVFSINFVPQSAQGTANSVFALRYTVNGVQQTTGSGVNVNSIYHLTVSVNVNAGSFNIGLATTNGPTVPLASNIPLSSASASSITDVAATWVLAQPTAGSGVAQTNAGSNSLLFDNYAVTVPEPSTWAIFGITAIVGFVTLRRRARA